MRKLIALGAMAATAAAACVAATQSGSLPRGPLRASLDPAGPADRQMFAFGREHPECPLWTNWQKLCSRTGLHGEIHCNIDTAASVTPSEPFCAAGIRGSAENLRGGELRSSERFCTEHGERYRTSSRGQRSSIRICRRHEARRPFNGRRLASLDHPACQAWADERTHRVVCSRGQNDRTGAPSCDQLAASGYEHSGLLICVRWSGATGCSSPQPTERTPEPGEPFIDDPIAPDSFPVRGVFCPNESD